MKVFMDGSAEKESGDAEAHEEDVQQLRRGSRKQTLTEKGKALQDKKIKGLKQRLGHVYRKWRTHDKFSKHSLT